MITLTLYDMGLTDKYIFEKLAEVANGQTAHIKFQIFADLIGCHRHTLSRAYHRLESAGKIETLYSSDKSGYIYRIISNE